MFPSRPQWIGCIGCAVSDIHVDYQWLVVVSMGYQDVQLYHILSFLSSYIIWYQTIT